MPRIRSVVVLCVAVLGACSSGTRSGGNPPRIASFTATPPLIAPGGSALLSWTATDVGAASLSPGVGAVTGTTSPVSPSTTTTYTLTVSNAYGADAAEAVVIVQPPSCVDGVACTPETPCHLGRITCASGGGVCVDTGVPAPDGTRCGAGVVVCEAGACVPACASNVACLASACVAGLTSCPSPVGEPVCQPVANAPDGTSCGTGKVCSAGSCVTRLCTAGDPCQPANLCQSGAVACTSPELPGTCVPAATRPDGTPCGVGLACLSGLCTGPPTIRSFTATPDDIGPGASSTLAWDVAGATTVTIDQGIGAVTGTSTTVSPGATTTYVLTASNAIGSAQRSVTVTYSTIVSVAMPAPFFMEAGTSVVLTPRVTVTGDPSIEMTWTLGPGSLGTVNPTRGVSTVYTAPGQPGTHRVYATSVWDPTRWDDSVITVVPPPAPDTWTRRAPLSTPRSGHTATLLTSGKVLVAGGASTASAEVYDPATGTWHPTAPMAAVRRGHAAVLLPSGRVLVVGGTSDTSAELYDPATNAWTSTRSMNGVHPWATATVLPSGRVLVLGAPWYPLMLEPGVAELFDPAFGEFVVTESIPADRAGQSATLLSAGTVLVAGGEWCEEYATPSATLYDPALAASAWEETGRMSTGREFHRATGLQSGNVLVSGGLTGSNFFWSTDLVEIYEARSGTWAGNGRMSVGRYAHTATLLGSGRVLFVGGQCSAVPPEVCDPECPVSCPQGALESAETFEPATDSWAVVAPMSQPRQDHTATLLPSGRVLVVGGDALGSVEEYTP